MRNDSTPSGTPFSLPFVVALCMLLIWGSLYTQPLRAAPPNRWLLCGPTPAVVTAQPFDPAAPLEFSADSASFDREGISSLSGDVLIRQGNRALEAATAIYDHRHHTVQASGTIHYRDHTLEVTGEEATLDLRTNTGSFRQARYHLPLQHASGTALSLSRIDQEITRLRQVSYTTCNPNHIDWQLRASEIRLDRRTRMGSARNVSVRFKNVPFFYFPYLAFPIADERISGFLMPDISVNLSQNTTDIAIPYYWNIAPNYDATIIPRFISRRGALLGGEFRYLTPSSNGIVHGEYLLNDRAYGDTRALLRFRHHSRFSPHWSATIRYNYVSDRNYFVDMGDSFNPNTTTHQERRMSLLYRNSNWLFSGTLLSYQMLLGTTPPYQKFPELKLSYLGRQGDNRINYHFAAEYTYFDDNSREPTGSRFNFSPGISYPMRTQATFLVPRITLHHTLYQLDKTSPGIAPTPSRTLPAISLDSGVFLERTTRWGGTSLLQTLEPRLFYLYIPYRDQNDLPNFDTASYTFDYAQLFRENRFTNVDRINDANQISIGVTTRYLESNSGTERLRASAGQIFYLDDRRVSLNPGDATEHAGSSDLAAELRGQFLNDWSLGGSLLWDPQTRRSRRFSTRLQYRHDARHLFTIDYRHLYEASTNSYRYKRFDLSGAWAINRHWYLLGHWNYDLGWQKTREALLGFGYDSCCWGVRLVSREFRNDSTAELNRAIFVNLELKGLSNINGEPIDALLKDGILGYEAVR